MDATPSRRGLTLVELLAVIAIIGLLVAFLMPALQSARESSRRTTCSNKIRQIALAAIQFQETQGAFPAGLKSPCRPPTSTPGQIASFDSFSALTEPWSVMILPQMGDMPRFSGFNPQAGFAGTFSDSGANRTSQFQPNSAFHCPSDPNSVPQSANTNYMAVGGGGVDARGTSADQVWARANNACCYSRVMFNNGLIFVNSQIRPGHVRDGFTNVFLIAETKYQMLQAGAVAYAQWYNDASYATEYPSWATSLRASNVHGDCCVSVTTVMHAVDGINSSRVDPTREWTLNDQTRLFGSNHLGGCMVAMAAGSTHFLDEQMDINVYRQLAIRNDGLPSGGFSP
jgi:prepilin-type N-terminal cleavage/methylation domain-containing protein